MKRLIIILLMLLSPVFADELPVIDQPEPVQLNSSPIYKPYEPAKTEIIFSTTKNHINAINPTPKTNSAGSWLPGTRGPNQLIIYTSAYGKRTNTNEYGAEAITEGNIVTELSGADSLIPRNGVVISGHGNAKIWLNTNISIGTKIYIDTQTNTIYTYTTSESYLFETEKKIAEAEQMIEFYRETDPGYNWKVPCSYINDAKMYHKQAQKSPEDVQQYSKLAIEAANDALKSVLPYKKGELKGVWLRPTEKTPEDIIKTLDRIQSSGIDNVFLETYFHGQTIFPSKTMEDYGFTVQNEQFEGIDPLKIWIEEGSKRNIKIHTWFETFYVGNQPSSPQSILGKNPSWGNRIRRDYAEVEPTRNTSEHNGYFLDPANPQVQDFLLKLLKEIATDYKPYGINIDYIRYPTTVSQTESNNWGYTTAARNEFKSIYNVDPIDIKIGDMLWPAWTKYRRDKVSGFVKKVGELGRQTNTYTTAVVFPDRLAALENKNQDWSTWSANHYINGFTPLFLTCDSKTAAIMMKDLIKSKSPETDFYAGIFVTFMNGSEEDLIRQIHEARKQKAKGVIIFDYAHLADKYVNTLATSVFATPESAKASTAQPKKKKHWWQRRK